MNLFFFYKSGKHYIITSISSYQQVCLRWSQAQNKSTEFEIVKQNQLNSKETFLDTPCEGTVCNTDFLVVYTCRRKNFVITGFLSISYLIMLTGQDRELF
jgi:hypothetical protein